jgi:hypothetical protein
MSSGVITLNQDTDTPARHELGQRVRLTYLYDRSRDSKNSGATGQDFIAYAETEACFAFALCDGVSQSFYGDLAARFVGERLVAWLLGLTTPRTEGDLAGQAETALRAWVAEATELVAQKPISDTLPPIVRDALNRKRAYGSESMFVAGKIDFAQGVFAACWLGDSQLRLWDTEGQPLPLPNAIWETRQRWSTKVGPKNGAVQALLLPLAGLGRISAHSDGLLPQITVLDQLSLVGLDDAALLLANAPASDDVTLLDITLLAQPAGDPLPATQLSQPQSNEPVLTWPAVTGATWYRLAISAGGRRLRTIDSTNNTCFIPPAFLGPNFSADSGLTFRVQAMANDRAAGLWSAPFAYPSTQLSNQPLPPPMPDLSVPPLVSSVQSGYEQAVVRTRRPFPTRALLWISGIIALGASVAWHAGYLRW